MISKPTYFYIPPKIEAGIASGKLTRHGGIVRNRAGQIVKHLKEVHPVANKEEMAQIAATLLKNPRVFIPIAILSAAIAGVAVYLTAKKHKQGSDPEMPEHIQICNASLAAYMEALHEERLDLDILDRLIAELDATKEHFSEEGDITLRFPPEHAETLVKIVVNYTRQLTETKFTDMKKVQESTGEPGGDTTFDIYLHLKEQRRILTEAA
ncbi:hypothetical protein [Streptomyces alkaliphilus]|uniref:hypothetical protein n=1 Tax=Streptomyces alkaliphilus TaxID=1472722 RepID=UPI0011802C8F|nr:hypothetical protein [Streptomyces alkaliphilus]MQS07579.1 hypothetical protein [Streptomyces alkaliphilus]